MSKALIADGSCVVIRGDVVRRGLRVSGIVGTTLVAINHGDVIAAGMMSIDPAWKTRLAYCVPYLVSTYAGVATIISTSGMGEGPD